MLFIIRDNAGPVFVPKPTQHMSGTLRQVLTALGTRPGSFKQITLYYRSGTDLVHIYVTGQAYARPRHASELRVEARLFNLKADVDHGVSPVVHTIGRLISRASNIGCVIPFVDAEFTAVWADPESSGGSIQYQPTKTSTLQAVEIKPYLDFKKWVDATVRRITNDVYLVPEEEHEGFRGLLNDLMRRYNENKDKWTAHQVDWGDIGETGIDPAQVVWAPGGRHGVIYTRILERTPKKPRKR